MKDVYLSVIIPAYNEEKRIADTIMDVSRYLSRQQYSAEIIVVNDGSKDCKRFGGQYSLSSFN